VGLEKIKARKKGQEERERNVKEKNHVIILSSGNFGMSLKEKVPSIIPVPSLVFARLYQTAITERPE